MSASTGRQPSGSIVLNGLPYFLDEDPVGAPIWQHVAVPTQDGDPTVPRWRRFNDWSRGMGDSRGAFHGSVEYAENAYLGAMGRILPGHGITEITTGLASDGKSFVDVTAPANRILAGGGLKIVEINPSGHTVATTQTFGSGSVLSMALFKDIVAIALGDTFDFQTRSAAGTYAANSISYKARAFGISDGSLVRGRSFYWSRATDPSDFFSATTDWSAEYDIGDQSAVVNQVFGHNRWDYILKDEGVYTFDEETDAEANVLTDLATFKSVENRSFFRWYDYLFVCSLAGLYRYIQQGAARTVGIEEVPINESELSNVYPTAGVAFGRWAYVAYYNGTSTWICLMRRAQDGDASFGSPFTLVSVIDKFTGKCQAMHLSSLSGTPTAYYFAGANVRYFALTRDGLPAAWRASGTTTVRFAPTDLGSPTTVKYFRKIEAICRNLSAARTLQWRAIVDGGSLNAVGAALTAVSASQANAFWTLASNDNGRVVQLVAELGLDSASVPPEIRDVVLHYEERPDVVPGAAFVVRLEDYAGDQGVADRRTALTQRQDLEALIDGAPCTLVDPYGDSMTVRVATYQGEMAYQRRGQKPQDTMQLQVRRLDYA